MASYGSIANGINPAAMSGDSESEPLIKKNVTIPIESRAPTPSQKRSLWSLLVFGWFSPLLYQGKKKGKLDPDDLDMIPFPGDCQTDHVVDAFDAHWGVESKRKSPSLFRSLFHAFGKDFIRAGFLKLLHDCSLFVGPLVLNAFIYYLRDANAPVSQGLFLTAIVSLSQLMMSFCLRHYFFKCYLTGLRIRTAVVVAVYRKTLVLASVERQTRTVGEITNLMSVDAQRLQDLTTYVHAVWYSFLQIGLAMFFLWQQLGPSCLGGVAVILVMLPVTKFVAQWMGSMQKKLMNVKDKRVELNSEVLGNMKVVKLQAWEESFQDRLLALRQTELGQLLLYSVGNSLSTMIWTTTPLLVALSTFAAYVWLGHQIEVASALTALALFDILRFPLFMLPQVINRIVEASVSLNRVRTFLLCDEKTTNLTGDLESIGIKIKNGSFAYETKKPQLIGVDIDPTRKELADKQWEVALLRSQLEDAELHIRMLTKTQSSSEIGDDTETAQGPSLLCLKRIDFECGRGELIAVVGGVGCGKTSFLSAILGEIRQLGNGNVVTKGSTAYFFQSPFILNASVRDNILFGHIGEPIDEERYQRALSCCDLYHDLEQFPDGDRTEIGEKGITLSGGQKARVAMARVVYHRADISLLDDPLAAVDAHVGRHLFQKCIIDELLAGGRRRSVILVTNALQHLSHPRVDRIVVVRDGRIVEQGTYAKLSNDPISTFSRFLAVMDETGVSPTLTEGCDIPMDGSQPKLSQHEPLNGEDGAHEIADNQATTRSSLMTDELQERETGRVGLNVYLSWAHAAGGYWVPFVIVSGYGAVEGMYVISKWWLAYWSQHAVPGGQGKFLMIYAMINLAVAVVSFFRMILLVIFGLKASRQLFADLLKVMLQAPMSFFDTTPTGRIVNRFSKDIYTLDEDLISNLKSYLATVFSVISTIVVISGVTPMFMVCLIPVIVYYMRQQAFFTVTYRELKRLDSVNRSPIYALLGETLDGVATIRAFSAERTLARRLTEMLDKQQHAYYLTCTAQNWLAVRLELVGTLIISFACLCAVLEHITIGPDERFAGLAGLSISFALSVTQSLNWSVRMGSDFEASMISVERIVQYCTIKGEAPRVTEVDSQVATSWPSGGEIDFQGVTLRYRPGLPLVLKGLNIRIPPSSKVGVVGRTGAGKSTLMVALMRIVELDSGTLMIDGIDIKTLGLANLRSKIAVVPQDPVLFSGTVRTNLDPFNQFADVELYEVLSRVGLYTRALASSSTSSMTSLANSMVQSLDDHVFEGGNNFSVGQRQLLVIARALLRDASIVIADEASAAVDADTDSRIQKVMRTEFAKATCITVAHRLNTIMDSDYILVMDNGRAAEFDKPATLLSRGGLFRDLVTAAAN